MPRVLITWEPPDGGVAEHVLQLTRVLPDRGFEVALAGPHDAPHVYDGADPAIEVHRIAYRRDYGAPAQDAAAGRQLAKIVREGSFDLVHAHSSKAGVLARLALAGSDVCVVCSPHCFPFVGPVGLRRRAFAATVEYLLAPAADRIVCVCEDERRNGARIGIRRARMRVVRNGSPAAPDPLPPNPVLEAFRGDDGVLVGSVAVLREQKRVDLLIDAAPAILAHDPRARVAIVGDGPLEAALHARASALGLLEEPRFAFFPFEPPPLPLLAALDVFVLPSAWEAFPIAVLEALATGTPQIVTRVGGTSEAVVAAPNGTTGPVPGETGILVPPGDYHSLAAAAIALVADPARREAMATASRARHAELFTLDAMADGIARVYRELLER
jgi:glycosyltransferase involved in cell wall biosynthesis